MSLEDIPTMVLEIAEFAGGSRGKDTGNEDLLWVVTMEVLDLDGNVVDANLIIRDVREVVASGSQGDVTVRNLLLVPSEIRRGGLKAMKSKIDERGKEEQG